MEQEQQLSPAEQREPEIAPAPSAAVAPSVDPALLQAQQELQQYRTAIDALQPHADIVARLMEDPDAAKLINESLSAYDTIRRQQPQIPDEIRPVYDKVSYLSDKLDSYEKERDKAAAAAQAAKDAEAQAQLQVEMAYASRLIAEHPELQENNYRAIRTIKQYANEDGISFESAYKRYGNSFTKNKAESAPPASLRADAGEIGIPAQSRATGTDGPLDFRRLLLDRLKKAQ